METILLMINSVWPEFFPQLIKITSPLSWGYYTLYYSLSIIYELPHLIDAKIFQASLLYLKPFDVMYGPGSPGSKDHVVTPEIFSTQVRGVALYSSSSS